MNRLFLMMLLIVLFIAPQAWGATTTQYPNPYRQTMWNNITDGVHTMGQNSVQTQATINKLHAARLKARLQSINQDSIAKRKAKMKAWQASQNSTY